MEIGDLTVTPLSDTSSAVTAHQRPTMRHVAVLAGVGIKTVSRVINGEPNVSEETKAKVLAAAQSLHYLPDPHAGNLRRSDRTTKTIGLLVGNVGNPFAGAVHRAIEDAASARGVAVFASSLDDDPERELAIVATFLRRRVDGLILTTASKNQSYLIPEHERGTQFVFVDREPVGIEADAVVSDNALGASTATRHLIEHGHRRIAFLGDRSQIQTARERRRGFLDELGRAGISTNDVIIIEGLHNEDKARSAMTKLLDNSAPPTAVFGGQDLITIGAIRALRARNMHKSIALVGFDDFELADLLEPGISVISQDPRKIGALAAARLFARLEGDRGVEQTYVVPTRLITRGSGEIAGPS
jgi:LacI family transcriptional regulator